MFRQWFGLGNPGSSYSADMEDMSQARTLDCMQLNEEGEIEVVPEESLLEALGFRPGKRVCLRCRTRFGGPLVAEIEGRHTALGRDLARKIRLRKQTSPCSRHDS